MANVSMHGFSAADIDRLRSGASSPVTPIASSTASNVVSVPTTAPPNSKLDSLWDQAFNILKEKGIVNDNGILFETLRLRHLPKLNFGQLIRLNKILDDTRVCKFKLDEQGESFEFPFLIRNYLLQLLEWSTKTQDEKMLIEDIEIVGGSVAYILGWEYFEFVMKLIFEKYQDQTGVYLQINTLFPRELIYSIQDELAQYPKDIDIRVWMKNADAETREEIKKVQIGLLLQIAEFQKKGKVPKYSEAFSKMLVNAKNVDGQEQFFVMSVSNRSKTSEIKVDINFVQSGRQHLFDRDAMGISLGPMFYSELKYAPYSAVFDGSQFILDRFTRRIGIGNVETINERGWGILQSLCLKGYRTFEKDQEVALFNRTLRLIENEYPNRGKFFAENFKANLLNHHQNKAIDAALLFIRFYNALEKVLRPEELKLFQDEASKYIKTLPIPESVEHPFLKEILKEISTENMSAKDAMASISLLGYLYLESPSQKSTNNLKIKIVDNGIEIISTYNDSTYTLRAPYSLEEALKHLAKEESKVTIPLYNSIRVFNAYNHKKVSQLQSINDLDSIEILLKGDESKKRLGYELLMLAEDSTSKPQKKMLLLRYMGAALFLFKPQQRAAVLEQLERVFVKGQELTFPELFTHKAKTGFVSAKTLAESKEAWFDALSKTTLIKSSDESKNELHFTKKTIVEIATEIVQSEHSSDWDSSESGIIALEIILENKGNLSPEDLKKTGLRLVDALLKKKEWKKALETLSHIKQFAPSKSEVQERLKTLPMAVTEDSSCHLILLDLFEQSSYTDGQAWYFLFKSIGTSKNTDNVLKALSCLKTTVIPQNLLKGGILGYSRMLKCLLDVLIEQNHSSVFDFCGDLDVFKRYFKTQNENYYLVYLRKILAVLKKKLNVELLENQRDNFIALLDALIPMTEGAEKRDLKFLRIQFLIKDEREDRVKRALNLVVEFYQEYSAQEIPKEDSFQHIEILLKKIEKLKDIEDINESVASLLKAFHKHVVHNSLIKFAVERALEFNELVNLQAVVLFNTFIIENSKEDNVAVEYLPDPDIYIKVYLKGLRIASNEEHVKEFKCFLFDTFWKKLLTHKQITLMRNRFADKLAHEYSINSTIQLCQGYLNYLVKWAEVEKHAETLRIISILALDPLIHLVSKYNDRKLFGENLSNLSKAVLYYPKEPNELFIYYVDELQFDQRFSYQVEFNNDPKCTVDTTIAVMSVFAEEESGPRYRDERESEYIFLFKKLMKQALKNKSESQCTAYFRDFVLYNILTFIEFFPDKKRDTVELIHDFVQSVHPSSILHEKHIENCKNLISIVDKKNLFDGYCSEAVEIAFLLAGKRTNSKLALNQQAEILYKVVENVISCGSLNPGKSLAYAIQIVRDVQHVILINEGEIRYRCYLKIIEAFAKIPYKKPNENNLANIIYCMIFPENNKFLSSEKKYAEINAKAACAYVSAILNVFNENSSKCPFEIRKNIVNYTLMTISNCEIADITRHCFKSFWDSFDQLFNLSFSYIKDFPDKSGDITSCFTIILKGHIMKYCSSGQAREKIKCMNNWLNSLIGLPNTIHVKIAYNVATKKEGLNVYAIHSQLFLDYEARMKELK